MDGMNNTKEKHQNYSDGNNINIINDAHSNVNLITNYGGINTISASASEDQFDVIDTFNDGDEPTSQALNFCKKYFLRKYICLLGLVGLYPNTTDISCCLLCSTTFQTILVSIVCIIGYVLQYYSAFRRDRGFLSECRTNDERLLYKYTICNFSELFFAYILPSVIHFIGFGSAIYVFRINNEHFENLVERVFLMSTCVKRLCIQLWLYVLAGYLWLIVLLCYLIVTVINQNEFGLTRNEPSQLLHISEKIGFVFTMFTQDLIQMMILTSYCIQCYLLKLYLYNLREKLIQHTIESIDWMREILEFRKLLNILNYRITIPVCFFTILNLSYSFSATIYLFKEYDFNSSIREFSLNIASLTMWLIIGLLPFFQAASVTKVCQSTQASGHQIRIRPFVYDQVSEEHLDSTLLFASSLNMSANLFKMPIQENYLWFVILVMALFILTIGMCLKFSLGIIVHH